MSSNYCESVQNDPMWTQNGSKWAQLSLNEPKWAEKSLHELKF